MSSWSSHVFAHGEFIELASNLWVLTGSLIKSPLPRNMVVYRLPSGGLWIHSAIALDEAGMSRLESFGSPEILVVPNRFHRADAAVYKERYPELIVCCPEGTRTAVESVVAVDKDDVVALEGTGISIHQPVGENPFEHVYELPIGESVALICADTVFNIQEHFGGIPGFISRYITGSTGFFGVTRIGSFFLWGKTDRMKGWLNEQAERTELSVFCMSHGEPITTDLGQHLRAASARL